jgi:uncharacterized protein YhaN
MASLWNQILEEEVEELEHLQGLMREERECLVRMDRDALLRLAREKEALARRMRDLMARKERLEEQGLDARSAVPPIPGLLRTRHALVEELREMSRVQREMVDTQQKQVGQLLVFLQNLRCRSTTYDCKGNFK